MDLVSASRRSLDAGWWPHGSVCAAGGVRIERRPCVHGPLPAFWRVGELGVAVTRDRLMARTANGVQEWSAWGGPTPARLLRRDDACEVLVVVSRHGTYDQVLVGRTALLGASPAPADREVVGGRLTRRRPPSHQMRSEAARRLWVGVRGPAPGSYPERRGSRAAWSRCLRSERCTAARSRRR
jgi:hypothetical protein